MKTRKENNWTIHHRLWAPILAIIFTIIASRIITIFINPNPFIGNIELHHFHYGLLLLITTSLLMLYKRINFKASSLMLGVSIGLIIDETVFISEGGLNDLAYRASLVPTIFLIFVVIFIIEATYHFKNRKNERNL